MDENIIYKIFEQKVKEDNEHIAVFDTNRKLTRYKFDKLINAIVSKLPENSKRVGIIMDHSVEMIASIFAVLKMGACYVPVEPFFPVERIKFMMKEAGVNCIITNSKYSNIMPDTEKIIIDEGFEIGENLPDIQYNKINENDPAYILYTSGTTGRPKGVAVTNKNVCHYVRAFQNEFHPNNKDIMLQYSVCSFDIFVEEVFTTLLSGGTLAIPSNDDKSSINKLMQFVDKNKISIISGFPYLLQEMNTLDKIPDSLRLLISGGDVIRESYITNLKDKVEIYNTYGPSETTVCASYYNCSKGYVLSDGTYPIGKAVKGAEIVILDKSGKKVKGSEKGEICILGNGVSKGYIGNRKEENRAFEKLKNGQILYHSGDLGYFLPDGNIAFLRRCDAQVMILGKRVEPDEVKNVLLRCPKIRQAFVLPRLDENNLHYMTAYFVKEKSELKLDEIKTHLKKYLTDYMIPEYFVELDKLPLTPNGKVDKSALSVIKKECAA